MAKEEHLKILDQGVEAWNSWREENPQIVPDLKGAMLRDRKLNWINLNNANITYGDLSNTDFSNARLNNSLLNGAKLKRAFLTRASLSRAILSDADLSKADLSKAELARTDLRRARLSGSILNQADLSDAKLNHAQLPHSKLFNAYLSGTDFTHAYLSHADLSFADLSDTNFEGADITYINLCSANLEGTNFYEAMAGWTLFSNIDLSKTKALETVKHTGPSFVSIETIYKSGGVIPVSFLHGCGVPDGFTRYLGSIVGAQQASEFYSCFISYSHKDEDFAKRLHSRLRDEHIRVWFAPDDIKGGLKLEDQIDHAIRIHDRLLLVLSKESLESEWVMTEIRKARQTELREKRRKLFPIRLIPFAELQTWKCFDAENGKDLAVEVREYFIPDFSNWKNQESFELAFRTLLRDLSAEDPKERRV